MTSTGRGRTRLLLAPLFAMAIAIAGFAAPVIAGANDPNRTEAVIEQDLGEHAAGRVPDDDRRTIQFPDQVLEHLDDLRHLELLDRRGVSAERLDLDLEPRIRRCQDL